MNSKRIQRLKDNIRTNASDIEVFRSILKNTYDNNTDKQEILRKAEFLERFSREIPTVVDSDELLVGSMRFSNAVPPECGSFHGNLGHVIADYGMFINKGIENLKNEILDIGTEEKQAFLRTIEALSTLIKRYGEMAHALSIEMNSKDMLTVSRNCEWISRKAPNTFWQALQLVWFIHLFLHAEGMSAAVSFGRFDQYLFPYYAKDIESGILLKEQAKELLKCFWLKTCEGDESQNLTLGGNLENELSLLCLEITEELGVWQPSVSVRIADNTSERFWNQTISLVKSGIGMPSMFNDNTIIKSLKRIGISSEDAEDYGIIGCYEANPNGKALGLTVAGSLKLHEVLLNFLNTNDDHESFDDLYIHFKEEFKQQYISHYLSLYEKRWQGINRHMASPFESICLGGCLESGIAAENGGAAYTMFGVNILGLGTLIDSFYVIKELVFEKKEFIYEDFVKHVNDNFPDRLLAQRCKNMQGKYGTDNHFTNFLANDLSTFIANTVIENRFDKKIIMYPGFFQFLADVYSNGYPATPDGRLHGERISYGISASDFCCGKTVTTMLNSASNVANDLCACGNPIHLFFSKKDMRSAMDFETVKALISSYFEKGGFHLQMSATDGNTLREAQMNPDAFNDLFIRISGYSTKFVSLDETLQNALIERVLSGE